MADIGTIFTDESADRIAGVVKRVEGEARNAPANRGGLLPTPVQWVPYVNTSTATVPPFGVLQPTTHAAAMFSGIVAIRCTRPSTVFTRIYAVNGPQAVPADKAGVCRFEGPCLIAYDTGTAAPGEGWGPKAGQFTLSKGYPRTTTVIANTTSTSKWLVGTLEPIDILKGKLAEACSVGESLVDVDIWYGGTGTDADLAINVDAHDWLMKSGATDIASGKKVILQFIDNKWIITEAECA